MSELDYHSRPEISRSMLATFIRSPRLYEAAYVKREIRLDEETDAMVIGTLTHQKLLEPNAAECVKIIPDEVLAKNGARSGNAWKEFEAANSHVSLLKRDDYDTAMRAIEAVRKSIGALIDNPKAERERMIVWHDDESGLDLRAKLDLVVPTKLGLHIVDMKTTAQLERFQYEIRDRLWLQFSHYRAAALAEFGEEASFFFSAVEKSGTFRVRNVTLNPESMLKSDEQYRFHLNRLGECHRTGDWSEEGEGEIVEVDLAYFEGAIR